MSMLEEIQNEAVDSNSDLGSLLRKCKVLAARLGSQPLEDWLIWEANGYPKDVQVPQYRIWPLSLKGHFAGPFGSGMKNAPIPLMCLPDKVRGKYEKYNCRQSIASIEQIIKEDHKGRLHVPTGDLAVVLGEKVYEGQNCIQVWSEFGAGNLIEVLNAVRNRVLDFTIAIWKENPNAGDASKSSGASIEPSKVTQHFNTIVYGGSANLVGSAVDSTVTFDITSNDFSSLEKILSQNNIEETDINELRDALEADERPAEKGRFGPRVSGWISGMMKKAAEGSWTATVSAAGNILGEAISKYYGF